MGTDGDDNPAYARPKDTHGGIRGRTIKVKLTNGKTDTFEVFRPGDIGDTVRVKPRTNPAGEIVDGGHGFIVNDPRSRPWKTARRTHCAYCGGNLPTPKVTATKYRCEFDIAFDACRCSGCILRHLVVNGYERNRGQPRKCCTAKCTRLRDNERGRWQRAKAHAIKNGQQPPPEPEDRGVPVTIAKRTHRHGGERAMSTYSAAYGVPVAQLSFGPQQRFATGEVMPWMVRFWAADPWLKFFRAGAVPIGVGRTISYADPVGAIASVNADRAASPESIREPEAALLDAA